MTIEADGPVTGTLQASDYTSSGELKDLLADLNLVVGSAKRAEQFIQDKQYSLLWRDSDILFQAPRPLEVYENTYQLTPNVQRFTVAKTVNAIVPQLYKGLFYSDPPMILRPRPGTSQEVTDAKTVLFSYLMDDCKFKSETKWGLEQMAHLGTGIWKWGIEYKEIITEKRIATVATLSTMSQVNGALIKTTPTNEPPKIITETRVAPRPFIESCRVDRVFVDPKTSIGDIRSSKFVVDVREMDYYQLKMVRDGIAQLPDGHPDKDGWKLPESDKELMSWFMPPEENSNAEVLSSTQATFVKGIVHHSEDVNIRVSPDFLMDKKEVLEYWDKDRKILVINRKKVICSTKNRYGVIPFLSSNWWNRPKAFYGMGIGLIVGQNQRVDQGAINAVLKLLSFGINPVYLRKRDTNQPTQMIRTGLGKILSVDNDVKDAYALLETPRVPPEVFSALQESQQATETSSGADQKLVGGSSSQPGSSMGRTAGGASLLAGASATRLDGPLDNFIEQVFKPFLYILDMLIFKYMSDAEIFAILGDEMGKDFELDLQKFHEAKIEYEVLAGSSLAAKRTMAQSITLITQLFETPAIQQNLAEINQEYIDFKPILNMMMEASEWKNRNDIIKPLTAAMQQRQQQQSEAAQQAGKLSQQMQLNSQKFQQKQQLEDQATNNRIRRDVVLSAFKANDTSEADTGTPSGQGLEGQMPSVI